MKMRILFIKPNMGLVDGKPYHDRGRMEPLTFAVIAGFTPDKHELHLCDDRFEWVPYDEPWDVVGINTEIYTAKRAYEIADRFRQGANAPKVIIGGYHTTLIPDESQAHADAIVVGEADTVWPELLEDIEAGQLKPRYVGEACNGTPINRFRTRYEIFAGKRYLPIALSQFSRGCPNRCAYCATGNIYRGRLATRPVKDVIGELAADSRRYLFFADDNIIADVNAAKQLFEAMIPLGIRWTGQASINFADDPELMRLMLKSGCSGLVVGLESRDPRNLEAMNKKVNLRFKDYDRMIERIRDAGIMLWSAFLLGYDHETPASIRETVDWALSKKFAFSAFNILMPYPGTQFYERMRQEGRLLFDGCWWLHDDYRFGHGAFRPRHMTAEQLGELGLEARLRHNTIYQIARRATDRKTNSKDLWSLLNYFAYNPLFRDEMLKKHGMPLGYRGFEGATRKIGSRVMGRRDRVSSRLLEPARVLMTRAAGLVGIERAG